MHHLFQLLQLALALLLWSRLSLASPQAGDDPNWPVYHNGNYTFHTCTPDQARQLVRLFATTGWWLGNRISQDADVGPGSEYGYETMFGTNKPSDVVKVFADINSHSLFSSVSGRRTGPVLFSCVNPGYSDDVLVQFCAARGGDTLTSPGMPVYLCPSFFDPQKKTYPSPEDCPAVNSVRNEFIKSTYFGVDAIGEPIISTRFGTLMYTLGRKEAPGFVGPDQKLWGLNECMNADPETQISNGNNYAYYTAFVMAGCTNFPQLGKKRRRQEISSHAQRSRPRPLLASRDEDNPPPPAGFPGNFFGDELPPDVLQAMASEAEKFVTQ